MACLWGRLTTGRRVQDAMEESPEQKKTNVRGQLNVLILLSLEPTQLLTDKLGCVLYEVW